MQNLGFHQIITAHIHLFFPRTGCDLCIPSLYTAADQTVLCPVHDLSLLKTSSWDFLLDICIRAKVYHRTLFLRDIDRCLQQKKETNKDYHEHLEGLTGNLSVY